MNLLELIQLHYKVEARLIPEFPAYAVSASGDVFSEFSRLKPPRTLRAGLSGGRYKSVVLVNRKGKFSCRVHRLVALTWIGPPPFQKAEVCHNDGNKLNNHVSNLRWDTHSNNQKDMVKHGTAHKFIPKRGEASHFHKFIEKEIKEIRLLRKAGIKMTALAVRFHCSYRNIQEICSGRTWKHLL